MFAIDSQRVFIYFGVWMLVKLKVYIYIYYIAKSWQTNKADHYSWFTTANSTLLTIIIHCRSYWGIGYIYNNCPILVYNLYI